MIVNLTNKKYISRNPFFAITLYERVRGMIGRGFHINNFDGMVFNGCNSIHTCFMTQKIDVIFIDSENKVVGLREILGCWIMAVRCKEAVTTIELPVGVIEHSETKLGDILNVSEEIVAGISTIVARKNMIQEMESIVQYKESKK